MVTERGLAFTAIDFETACAQRSSVCAVGAVKVRDGQVISRFSSLVQPPTGLDSFHPRNIDIHGITQEHVMDAPKWDEAFGDLMTFVSDDELVAHNAAFDRSVMQAACSMFDLDWPQNPWHDTMRLARSHLTLASYSLPFVSQALGLEEFTHHDALADAEQAALIAVTLAQKSGSSDLREVTRAVLKANTKNGAGSRAAGDFSALGDMSTLVGAVVAFTGKLVTNTRKEAIALVNHLGGLGQDSVTQETTILVTGDFDPTTFRPGAKFSSKLEKAMKLVEKGQALEILTEIDFLALADLSREELVRATREQRALSRGSDWLPAYVVEQARNVDSSLSYKQWMRAVLRNPAGRANHGDLCVRCEEPIDGDSTFWLHSERHVCGPYCGESLKRVAKTAWRSADITVPNAPTAEDFRVWRASRAT